MHNRYIQNNYNFVDINENDIIQLVKEKFRNLMQNQLYICPPDQKHTINSKGKKKYDWTIYTGTGGNIYLYWRNYLLNKDQNSLDYFKQSYFTNISMINDNYKYPTSFFMGSVGIYSMGCVLSKIIDDKKLFFENLELIIKYKEIALSSDSEDELLYGNAGYLYCLLLIHSQCKEKFDFNISNDIYDIAMFLYKIGKNQKELHKSSFLIYPFPRNDTSYSIYLGGAHGVIGVLYILLSAVYILPDLFENEKIFIDDIKFSLNSLSKYQLDSGNFPSSLSKSKNDKLVQFCHGATGAVYLYSLAYKIFKEESFLKTVLNSGRVIWERGLLKKGNGVCHGITGNAYSLNEIYILTKDIAWKKKMLCFAYATLDSYIQSICSEYDDPQRYIKGIPDRPYSLMEGNGGLLAFYCDLLNGDDFIKFPGYQLI